MSIALDLELADGALTFTNVRAHTGRAARKPVIARAADDEGYTDVELTRRDLVELRTWLDHVLLGEH